MPLYRSDGFRLNKAGLSCAQGRYSLRESRIKAQKQEGCASWTIRPRWPSSVSCWIMWPASRNWLRMMPSQRPHRTRSEEHTSELQSLMRISYAVFCLKKKKLRNNNKYSSLMSHIDDNTHIQSQTM